MYDHFIVKIEKSNKNKSIDRWKCLPVENNAHKNKVERMKDTLNICIGH